MSTYCLHCLAGSLHWNNAPGKVVATTPAPIVSNEESLRLMEGIYSSETGGANADKFQMWNLPTHVFMLLLVCSVVAA